LYTWDTLRQKILNGEISRENQLIECDSNGSEVYLYRYPYLHEIADLKLCFDEYAKNKKNQ
jgi:hypothetical protein